MKILIVEDEPDLRETIRISLLKENFVVETAADYYSALEKVNDYDYDCILLDIMLPGGSGLDLLRELKRLRRSDSVLIISAKDSLDDKVEGLELGADDYLTKPFHLAELNARVKSVIRRRQAKEMYPSQWEICCYILISARWRLGESLYNSIVKSLICSIIS